MSATFRRFIAGVIPFALATSVCASAFAQLPTVRSRAGVRAPDPAQQLVLRPVSVNPKLWKPLARSRGNRPIYGMKTGKGQFRVLILGSLKGQDPAALALVDQLAIRMTNNSDIIGGFESTVIRSLNPDGIALKRGTNEARVDIAKAFPRAGVSPRRNREPEIRFLQNFIRDEQPDRVVHITSGAVQKPLVLYNDRSEEIAFELSDWIDATPKTASRFAPKGSIEHYLGESAEVLTLVLPRTSKPKDVWKKYGDSLFATLALGTQIAAWPLPTASRPRIFPSSNMVVEELPKPPGR